MKKIFALMLTLCLLCGMAALADNNTITQDSEKKQATTTLTTTIDESYTISIPASLNIAYGKKDTALKLQISDYRLKVDHQIQVNVNWDGKLECSTGAGTHNLAYDLQWNGASIHPTRNPLIFSSNGSKDLNVKITESAWNSAAAGEYTDSVTFTAVITEK